MVEIGEDIAGICSLIQPLRDCSVNAYFACFSHSMENPGKSFIQGYECPDLKEGIIMLVEKRE